MSIATRLTAARRPGLTPALTRRRAACRPRTLADAMIIVAGTAIGLAMTRSMSDHWTFAHLKWMNVFLAAPCVATWTLTLLILRLRRPRAGVVRLARQPGMMACLAVATLLAIRVSFYLGLICLCGLNPWFWVKRLATEAVRAGYLVAVTWLTLAITGRRRPEPGWIDRLGRILGAYWIVLVLMSGWFDAQSLIAYSRRRPPLPSYLAAPPPIPPGTLIPDLLLAPPQAPTVTPPVPSGDEAPPAPAPPVSRP